MSIIQVTPPESLPVSTADYQAQNNLTDSRITNEIYPVDSGNVLKGAKFIIQGATFIADSDTLISGTESLYVKLVVSGTTATAEYIPDLTGVTWSDVYNGYYNGSGEYVFFDEALAFLTNEITLPRIIYNKIITTAVNYVTNQLLKTDSDVEFRDMLLNSLEVTNDIICAAINTGQGLTEVYLMDQNVREADDVNFNSVNGWLKKEINIGSWDMNTDESVVIAHGLTSSKMRIVSVLIYRDESPNVYDFQTPGANFSIGGGIEFNETDITLERNASGFFDSLSFDDTVINRGIITIEYKL